MPQSSGKTSLNSPGSDIMAASSETNDGTDDSPKSGVSNFSEDQTGSSTSRENHTRLSSSSNPSSSGEKSSSPQSSPHSSKDSTIGYCARSRDENFVKPRPPSAYQTTSLDVDLFPDESNDGHISNGEERPACDAGMVPDPPSPLTTDRFGLSDDEPMISSVIAKPSESEKVFTYLMCMLAKGLRVFL